MKKNRLFYYFIFIISLIYGAGIIYCIETFQYFEYSLFWLTGMVLVTSVYFSFIPAIESCVLFITLWLFFPGTDKIFISFPLVSAVIIFAGHKAGLRLSPLFVILWFFLANKIPLKEWKPEEYFIFISTLITLIIYFFNNFKTLKPFKNIDVIFCTYSSNTGHYTKNFIDGLKQAGAEVKEHFFHYSEDFKCDPRGEALVISYPVYGWKTPWHFAEYIIKKLPSGRGKPAFILYTAAGGPENAGVFAYMLLTLKGYRVMGRAWGLYPLNVATFRPLPDRLHRYLDKFVPWKGQIDEVIRYGYEFGEGKVTGYPFIFWPLFMIIVGYLLDNRWVNIFLYRNYVWKRRCVKCGVCIDFCPVKRLYFDDKGYPVTKGTCTLCLGCINLCPKNAMHLMCWTEYGRPYRPRWPEFLKKKTGGDEK